MKYIAILLILLPLSVKCQCVTNVNGVATPCNANELAIYNQQQIAGLAQHISDSTYAVEKSRIVTTANSAVGVSATSLTQAQINSLFAVIWYQAGGFDSIGRVKKIW